MFTPDPCFNEPGYEGIKGTDEGDVSSNFCNRQLRSTHHNRFTELRPRTEAYRNSFFCRAIKEWNSLPSNVLDIEKTSLFQKALRLD